MTESAMQYSDYQNNAARRGRAKLQFIQAAVCKAGSAGRVVKRIWINTDCANDLRALFHVTSALFDNVLPRTYMGIPLEQGHTGGHDFVFEYLDERAAATIAKAITHGT